MGFLEEKKKAVVRDTGFQFGGRKFLSRWLYRDLFDSLLTKEENWYFRWRWIKVRREKAWPLISFRAVGLEIWRNLTSPPQHSDMGMEHIWLSMLLADQKGVEVEKFSSGDTTLHKVIWK